MELNKYGGKMIKKLKKPSVLEGYNPTFLDKINEIIDVVNNQQENRRSNRQKEG